VRVSAPTTTAHRTVRFDVDRLACYFGSSELDGKRVMTRVRPPWTAELDLGSAPRLHRLSVLAESPAGAELARDEVLLNAGPHRFAVAVLRDPPGRAGSRRALIPEGERLERPTCRWTGVARHAPPAAVQLPCSAGAPPGARWPTRGGRGPRWSA
jgi:hypothetical protein